jgi:antitoxin FitA
MASLTIRNLDDKLKQHLRLGAAQHGRSMADEARDILRVARAMDDAAPQDLGLAVRHRFAPFGGVEVPVAKRELPRDLPNFDP